MILSLVVLCAAGELVGAAAKTAAALRRAAWVGSAPRLTFSDPLRYAVVSVNGVASDEP